MDRSSAALGDRCVKQIGANCRSGMESEDENKQRRHQRSAADAGQAYNEAHAESRQGIGEHDKFKRAHGMNSRAFTASNRCQEHSPRPRPRLYVLTLEWRLGRALPITI